MALPDTGPLSKTDIITEFPGDSSPNAMSEFYAGGSYVPARSYGINGDIPSSGEIKYSDFQGAAQSSVNSGTMSARVAIVGVFPNQTTYRGYDPVILGGSSLSDYAFPGDGASTINAMHVTHPTGDEGNPASHQLWLFRDDIAPGNNIIDFTWDGVLYTRNEANYSEVGGRSGWVWPLGIGTLPLHEQTYSWAIRATNS